MPWNMIVEDAGGEIVYEQSATDIPELQNELG